MTRRTITLRHLDNREFARIHFPTMFSDAALVAVMDEFECDESAVRFVENDDGELVLVNGQPVAQSYESYGRV